MRRMVLVLSFLAFMPAAYASQWRLVNQQRLVANTPDQIRMNLDRDTAGRFDWLRQSAVNALIVNQRIPALMLMNTLIGTYHWDGLSACDANDPRLTKQIDSGTLHFANGEVRSWNMTLDEKDPCAFGYSEPTRKFTESSR